MADAQKTATAQDVLATLQSIDSSLKALVAHLGAGARPATGQGPALVIPAIAPDHDLDSKWGDEKIKFNPRDWTGDSQVGFLMHECQPEFLDMLASAHDFFANKNQGVMTDKGQPKSMYDQRTASRARGWAARKRAGWQPPPEEPSAFGTTDPALVADDIPF